MNHDFLKILLFFFSLLSFSQQDFYVSTNGTSSGNGSMMNPWDLQTALTSIDNIDDGDTIYIYEGIYNGRFISTITSSSSKRPIKIKPYKNAKVILNGNIISKRTAVLEVKGSNISIEDIEITFIGDFIRDMKHEQFMKVDGVSHTNGKECQFLNLKIHNVPGSGFGSWKRTGGTIIEECIIFNNGYFSSDRGSGVGIYIQNESNKNKVVKNNIIFNNYYKGIEVWSANKNANTEYVKNVVLDNNIVFNNGLPSGVFRDNLIIATDDNNGINIAKNITVKNNIFYHNTKLSKTIENNNASSLTLGFNRKAPIENIKVFNNIIIGRKDAIRILDVKSLSFNHNIVYSGYVRFRQTLLRHINNKDWKFTNNTYYTRNNKPIRIQGIRDYTIAQWNSKYGLETQSTYKNFKEFNLKNVLNITKNQHKEHSYRIVLFNKEGNDVEVDFSKYNIANSSKFKIKNIETGEVISSGKIKKQHRVTFPMGTYNRTLNNFGVYFIEFEMKRSSLFERWFGKLF